MQLKNIDSQFISSLRAVVTVSISNYRAHVLMPLLPCACLIRYQERRPHCC